MRPKILLLEGVTRRPRHEVMMEIRDLVSEAGGWISGETSFAAMAVTFRLFIVPGGLGALRQGLQALAVHLDDGALERLQQALEKAAPQQPEILVALNVTFSQGV